MLEGMAWNAEKEERVFWIGKETWGKYRCLKVNERNGWKEDQNSKLGHWKNESLEQNRLSQILIRRLHF